MISTIVSSLLASGLLAKVLGGAAILAYLYSLYARFQSAMQQAAQAQVKAKISTDLEAIAKEATHVTETEKDYSNAVDNFKRNNT